MKRIEAAIAIVIRAGKILVCQRKDEDTFGGFWEFPGGKQEDGETLEQCLARELLEELNICARTHLAADAHRSRLPPGAAATSPVSLRTCPANLS